METTKYKGRALALPFFAPLRPGTWRDVGRSLGLGVNGRRDEVSRRPLALRCRGALGSVQPFLTPQFSISAERTRSCTLSRMAVG